LIHRSQRVEKTKKETLGFLWTISTYRYLRNSKSYSAAYDLEGVFRLFLSLDSVEAPVAKENSL
jgi:hypothetical protein